MTKLEDLAKKVRIRVEYGCNLPIEKQDEWQQNANSYRCTLFYEKRSFSFDYWQGTGIPEDPTAAGCLESLLSDASCSEDFGDFCSEFGYDTDSRNAEKIHKGCLKVAKSMKRLLGKDFEKFMESER